ncbi:MAG: putative sulfate exporter family transporter [Verrucomicrobiota bacterium]
MPSSSLTRDPFSGLELMSEGAFASLGSMEAMDWDTLPQSKSPSILKGLLLAFAITATAIASHHYLLKPAGIPLGSTALAMVVGIALQNLLTLPSVIQSGCRWIVTRLIPIAIVALGAGLDLSVLASSGLRYLFFIVTAISVSIVSALFLGKLLKLKKSTALLIGCGTGVCGSSAILAIAPILKSDEEDIIVSVGAINLIGILAMFICISIGASFHIDAQTFGIWTGATIHAVPTVAAAAFDHSMEAGEIATLVKLGRVAMLVPLIIIIALVKHRQLNATTSSNGTKSSSLLSRGTKLIPWFVWGFALMALTGSLGLLPELSFPSTVFSTEPLTLDSTQMIRTAGKLLLAMAMAAIGLQVNLKSMLTAGKKAIIAAMLSWVTLTVIVLTLLWLI